MKKLLNLLIVCFSLIMFSMLFSCNNAANTQIPVVPATGETTTGETTTAQNPENQQTTQPPASFTVSFVTDGGTEIASQTVTSGNKATRPSNPTKTGCTFVNWYTSSDFTTVFDFNTTITANTVLYAKWDIAEGYFKVTYNANGGTLSTTYTWQSVQSGTSLAAPAAPTKADGIFAGWYTEAACTNAFAFPHTITEAVTLYAKWTPAGIINPGVTEDITMSTTQVPGCYTFTISSAALAQHQQTVSQYQQNASSGTTYTLIYEFIITGQGFTYEDFSRSGRGSYTQTSNSWVCQDTLESNVNYRLIVRANVLVSNSQNTNQHYTINFDTLYYDFRG